MNDELSPLGRMVAGIAEANISGISAGVKASEQRMGPAIRALEKEFFAAMDDGTTKMRTALQIAICNVIALLPSANDYANAMVKRDQLARHEGRPEHDTDVVGRALKAGM